MNRINAYLLILLGVGHAAFAQNRPPEYEFMKAVDQGNLEVAKQNLDAGIDVNAKTPNGTTAAHIAAENCNLPMLKFLVSRGIQLNEKDGRGRIPLRVALGKGGIVIVFADRKPYKNCEAVAHYLIPQLPEGFFSEPVNGELLVVAASSSYPQVVERLLKKGAPVDSQEADGETALMAAAKPVTLEAFPRNIQIIKLLLKSGADKTLKNKKGQTAFDILNADKNPDPKFSNPAGKLLKP